MLITVVKINVNKYLRKNKNASTTFKTGEFFSVSLYFLMHSLYSEQS